MGNITDRLVPRYARWVIRRRWLVLLGALLLAAAASAGAAYLSFTSDYRVFFGPKNPELLAYRALEETYTKTDNVVFVLQPAQGTLFTRENLATVKRLTEEAWQIPSAIRVDSITNFQYTRAAGDDLVVGDLVEDPAAMTEADLAAAREVALAEPSLAGRLLSPDGRTTGVLVTLQFPGADHSVHLPLAVSRAEDMARKLRIARPDMKVALTGFAVMSDTEIKVSQQEMETLVPVMYGLIVIFLLLLLRSVSATFVTLVVLTLSVTAAVGMASWLGIRMNIAAASAPIIILTLAVADAVHILLTVLQGMRKGASKNDALVESLRVNAEPVFLTSLTTIIGFLSLNFSDSPPFHDLGNISAMGVFAAWVLAMTLLPALVSILPLRVRPQVRERRSLMDRFGDFVVDRRRALLWGMTAVVLATAAFIPRLQIDDRWDKWFDESVPFRADTDFTSANLVGPYTIEFSVGSGEAGGVSEPEYLERISAFAQWLRAQPDVTHVYSFSDVMKRLNKAMHGDDEGWYQVPEQRDQAAQYLLLYEMSLPYGLDLNSFVSVDKSATRVTATLGSVPSSRIREFVDSAQGWLARNTPDFMHAQATGSTIMFLYLTERNVRSMLLGTVLAFLLIAAVLIVALRSFRLGAISLVSNFFPLVMTFGLWSAFVGQIGIIGSVIAATSMGLIVDDTVHILSKYNRARREHGLSSHDAVRYSFSGVGMALWSTTIILVAGFAVLGMSSFKVNANLGMLTSIALVSALVVDFLLLPPLLMAIDRPKDCKCRSCTHAHA